METTKQDRDLSLLAHLLGILGFLGPMIIFLTLDQNKNAFAKDQAKEALNFQLFVLLCYIISGILTLILISFITFMLVAIVALVFCIIAAVQASNGISYRYPVTIRFIK